MKKVIHHVSTKLIWLCTIVLVLLAISLSTARLTSPFVAEYKPQLEQWAGDLLEHKVRIGTVDIAWQGLTPIVHFSEVHIQDQKTDYVPVTVQELDVAIDLWKSLWEWNLEPSLLKIKGASLNIEQNISGQLLLSSNVDNQQNFTPDSKILDNIAQWLLSQPKIILENISINFTNKSDADIPITQLEVIVKNKGSQHHLQLQAMLAEARIALIVDLEGAANNLASLKGNVYLQVQDAILPFWLMRYPLFGLTLNSGTVQNLEIWADWDDKAFKAVQATFIVNEIEAVSSLTKKVQEVQNFSANVAWKSTLADVWTLIADEIQIEMGGFTFPDLQLQLSSDKLPDETLNYQILLNLLPFEPLSFLYEDTTVLPIDVRELLTQLHPQGNLSDIKIALLSNEHGVQEWQIDSQLNQVHWQRSEDIPGISNLSGTLSASRQQGQFLVDSKNLTLDFGPLFLAPLLINELSTNMHWQQVNTDWQLTATDVRALNKEAYINGNVRLDIPKNGDSPVANAAFAYKNIAVVTDISQYLPVGIMEPELISWLRGAIKQAEHLEGNLILQGRLADFPFDDGTGSFIAQGVFNGVDLHYYDEWPLLQQLTGNLLFDKRSMQVDVTGGMVVGSLIQQAKATIADMTIDVPILLIDGAVQGDLTDGMNFIMQSPLQEDLAKELENFQLLGQAETQLKLNIPLSGPDVVQVDGHLLLNNAAVQMPQWNIALTQVTGSLDFTEQGLSATNLAAYFLDEPLFLDLATILLPGQPSFTQLTVNGSMDIDALQAFLGMNLTPIVSGRTFYDALIKIPSADSKENVHLQLSTDLNGVSLLAPAPFAKSYHQLAPTQVSVDIPETTPMTAQFKYADKLNGIGKISLQNKQWQLSQGMIAIGKKTATIPKRSGLTISGYLAVLSLSQWQDFFANLQQAKLLPPQPTKAAVSSQSKILDTVDLELGALELSDKRIKNLLINLQAQPTAWSLQLTNPNMMGTINIPYQLSNNMIVANFSMINMSQLLEKNPTKNTKATTTNLQPKDIPSLKASVEKLHFGQQTIHKLNVQVQSQPGQLQIQNITAEVNYANLTAMGYWKTLPRGTETFLQGDLKSSNYGKLLTQWNLSKNIEGTKGRIDFALSWLGAPYDPSYTQVAGKIKVDLGPGRVTDLSNSSEAEVGLGKALNLLSLSTLTRRMQLDFSDLYKKGFSFDSLKADIQVSKGIATIQRGEVNGPIAKITAAGDVNLILQRYNLVVNVTPYITSSIPVAAAIATGAVGGPIVGGAVGAAAWAVNKLISSSVAKLTTYHYRVTGTWDDPQITAVSADNAGDLPAVVPLNNPAPLVVLPSPGR